MKAIGYIICLICSLPCAWAADENCGGGLTQFTCADPTGNVILNRCATGNECYNKDHEGKELRCCPVIKNTDSAKNSFFTLLSQPSLESLNAFKKSCNYSSQIDFDGDSSANESSKKFLPSTNVFVIRSLFYAKTNCTDGRGTQVVDSWLGNEILINSTKEFIQAFSDENQGAANYKIVETENSDWLAIQCVDPTCVTARKEYFGKKRTVLKSAKIIKSLEPVREGLMKALKSDL